MKINLKVKFSILIGLVAFFVAMGIGKYSVSVSNEQLIQNSGKSLVDLSKRVADILDREMLERYREIQFASTMPIMTNKNATQVEKRAFLEKIKRSYGHHEWIGYALPDGTVYAGTSGYLEGKNAKARPWLPAGLKGPYIGDVHDALLLAKLLPNNNGEAIYFSDIAFPVKDKDGKAIAVLCSHLMWQWTRDIIRSIEKEHSAEIYLLSKDDLVLVGPGNSERKYISEISKNVVNVFKDQSEYKVIEWNLGEKYLTAHTVSEGFEEYKGFGWKVLVKQPINDAFKIAENNSNQIFVASILAGLIGSIIGILLASKISAPLEKLSSLVEDFKNGKDVSFKNKSSQDEVGRLYQALDQLYTSLNKESKLKEIAEDKVNISLKVFDQSLEGIVITDNENKIILTNKAFTDITGYTQEDVFHKDPAILSSGTLEKEFYENMWNKISEKGKWEGTIPNRRKDGTLYDEYLKISTLKDADGNIINYLATFNSGF